MSAAKFLLDTNVVIGLDNGHEAARLLVEQNGAQPGVCAVSQITRLELLSYHLLTLEQHVRLEALLSAISVVPLDEAVERETIAFRRKSRLRLPDCIIAGTARAKGLVLLTLDDKLANAFAAA